MENSQVPFERARAVIAMPSTGAGSTSEIEATTRSLTRSPELETSSSEIEVRLGADRESAGASFKAVTAMEALSASLL